MVPPYPDPGAQQTLAQRTTTPSLERRDVMESIEDERQFTPPSAGRRGFLKGLGALLMGGVAMLAAPVAGLWAFLQPLRGTRGAGGGRWVRVAQWSALPPDGAPRRFPVIADRVNAWTRVSAIPVGAVFLRRTGDTRSDLQALNVVCPHAGCLVDFASAGPHFLCPCHNSRFGLDGRVQDSSSPSPRGLDALEVEVRNGEEIWVRFQEYRVGIEERVPVV